MSATTRPAETAATAVRTYKNLIDGKWVASTATAKVANRNPANTDDVIGYAPNSTIEEARAAVTAAERALPAWRAVPAPRRGRILFDAWKIMERRADELARALTREEGKILSESRGEVQKALNVAEYIAGEGRRLNGETTSSELPSTFAYTVRVPLGVVSLITPWNFPVAIPVWKAFPALVAGNTLVWKPASNTPETATILAEILQEAGLPAGVLNMVLGSGSTVGVEFTTNPAIRAVSFTGSNEVGGALYVSAAGGGRKVQCEMGGKNPIVILEDADLALAIDATAQGAFGSTGQRCTATSRAIVMESIADKFVEGVVARAKALRVGDGMLDGIDMGPSVDEAQMNTVLSYLDVAKGEGLKALCGGARMTDGAFAKGYFVAPTVYDHVRPAMRIAHEEVFGPVLSVIRVKSFEEALAAANDCRYGLSSSIYSHDSNRIFKFIDAIETGITHVNSPTMGGEAHLPFGGTKSTGVGQREMGSTAIDFYTEWKTVYIDYTGQKRDTKMY
ncbi:MAG: aldehyde dehydrogenase family protein [bacterium]